MDQLPNYVDEGTPVRNEIYVAVVRLQVTQSTELRAASITENLSTPVSGCPPLRVARFRENHLRIDIAPCDSMPIGFAVFNHHVVSLE